MHQLRRILNFRKPEFINLDYIPLVIHQKKLLLISWHIPAYCRIHFSGLKLTKHSPQSALIIKIPIDKTRIELVLMSYWRKRKFILNLQEVSLSPDAASVLIQELKPLLMPELKSNEINIKGRSLNIDKIEPKLISKSIQSTPTKIQINQDALHFEP